MGSIEWFAQSSVGTVAVIYNERPADIRAAIYPGYGVFADKYPIDLDEEMSRSKLGSQINGGAPAFIDPTEVNQPVEGKPLLPIPTSAAPRPTNGSR